MTKSDNIITDRVPPHNVEAERAVLGGCLINPQAVDIVVPILGDDPSDAFYIEAHTLIYQAIYDLYRLARPVDVVTVHAALSRSGNIETVGGHAYLGDLMGAVGTSSNIDQYAREVREHAARRRVIDSCQILAGQAMDGSIEQSLASLDQIISNARRQLDGSAPVPLLASRMALDPPPLRPVLVDGLLRLGHKAIISGPSKSGKSFLALQLAAAVSLGEKWLGFQCNRGNVFVINLEVDAASYFDRLLKVREITGADLDKITILNLRGHTTTVQALCSNLERMAAGSDLIIIDPMFKLLGNTSENDATETASMLNCFERVSSVTGAAVCLIHHYAKGGAAGREATDRGAGSGVFGRDPDLIVAVSRLEDSAAAGGLGLRADMVCREFASPPSLSMRFEWPVHVLDPSLDDIPIAGVVQKHLKLTPEILRQAIEGLAADEIAPAVELVAKAIGVHKSRIYAFANRKDNAFRIKAGVVIEDIPISDDDDEVPF